MDDETLSMWVKKNDAAAPTADYMGVQDDGKVDALLRSTFITRSDMEAAGTFRPPNVLTRLQQQQLLARASICADWSHPVCAPEEYHSIPDQKDAKAWSSLLKSPRWDTVTVSASSLLYHGTSLRFPAAPELPRAPAFFGNFLTAYQYAFERDAETSRFPAQGKVLVFQVQQPLRLWLPSRYNILLLRELLVQRIQQRGGADAPGSLSARQALVAISASYIAKRTATVPRRHSISELDLVALAQLQAILHSPGFGDGKLFDGVGSRIFIELAGEIALFDQPNYPQKVARVDLEYRTTGLYDDYLLEIAPARRLVIRSIPKNSIFYGVERGVCNPQAAIPSAIDCVDSALAAQDPFYIGLDWAAKLRAALPS